MTSDVVLDVIDGRLPVVVPGSGPVVTLRELHESDESMLKAWFATVSPAARYQRFHGLVNVSPAHWRYLLQIDQVDHVAVIALVDGVLAGIARMIRLDAEPGAAEISFLVGDSMQRRGIGALLRDTLYARARARQYRRLDAYVLPSNRAIRYLLAAAGDELTDRGSVLEIRLRSGARVAGRNARK